MAETNILTLYETSNKPRVKEAREIPGQEVNYFDQNSKFQEQFQAFQELRKTTYTEAAYDYYEEMRLKMVIPESWKPAEQGINLNRWGPGGGYYNPGTPMGA